MVRSNNSQSTTYHQGVLKKNLDSVPGIHVLLVCSLYSMYLLGNILCEYNLFFAAFLVIFY